MESLQINRYSVTVLYNHIVVKATSYNPLASSRILSKFIANLIFNQIAITVTIRLKIHHCTHCQLVISIQLGCIFSVTMLANVEEIWTKAVVSMVSASY